MNKKDFKDFFDAVDGKKLLDFFRAPVCLFVIRDDGIPLYKWNNTPVSDIDLNALGALMAGAWQASESLMKFIKSDDDSSVCRFSFDSSSKGLFTIPLQFNNKVSLIGIAFYDENNPAKLKNFIKILKGKLTIHLEKLANLNAVRPQKNDDRKSKKKDEYLFQNISDEEIEKLFSFVGS